MDAIMQDGDYRATNPIIPMPGLIAVNIPAGDALLYVVSHDITEWYIERCNGRELRSREVCHSVLSDIDGVEMSANGPWYGHGGWVKVDGVEVSGGMIC